MREAEWFEEHDGGWKCLLCPRGCSFAEGTSARGVCRVRGVRDGLPYLPGYGECVSLSMDPIEKKPLYHFLPGSSILSTGPAGCNLRCDFCQNWSISQSDGVPTRYVAPKDLADLSVSHGSKGIAFTYTEPVIWFEYIADTAPLVREKGGAVVMVSNGEIMLEPLKALTGMTDAWNVDLKSWSDDFYRTHCGGDRATVLNTISALASSQCHLEITFLIIPGENDVPHQWKEMARWISKECGRDTVLHISRYFPRYRLKRPPTPAETLQKAREVFLEELDHVYPGNISTDFSDTFCPSCGALSIRRSGWVTECTGLSGGSCSRCGRDLNVVHEIG